jgi:hypothetical protein
MNALSVVLITGHSEPTFALRLRLLTGDMEAAGHEEEVMLPKSSGRHANRAQIERRFPIHEDTNIHTPRPRKKSGIRPNRIYRHEGFVSCLAKTLAYLFGTMLWATPVSV